jgi:hypothetical protein
MPEPTPEQRREMVIEFLHSTSDRLYRADFLGRGYLATYVAEVQNLCDENARLRAQVAAQAEAGKDLYEYTVEVERAMSPWITSRPGLTTLPRTDAERIALGERVRAVFGLDASAAVAAEGGTFEENAKRAEDIRLSATERSARLRAANREPTKRFRLKDHDYLKDHD